MALPDDSPQVTVGSDTGVGGIKNKCSAAVRNVGAKRIESALSRERQTGQSAEMKRGTPVAFKLCHRAVELVRTRTGAEQRSTAFESLLFQEAVYTARYVWAGESFRKICLYCF